MKKQIFYLASAALVAGLAACSNDELDENYSLNSNGKGFTATIQEATIDEDASTRLAIADTKLKWEVGDNIGLYNNNDENYEYKIADETNRKIGKFTPGNSNKTLEVAQYAYYPYDESAEATLAGNIKVNLDGLYKQIDGTTTEGKLKDGAIIWKDGVVKMPMVGAVNGSTIKFTNTTALLKVTVVNMPTTAKVATLSSQVEGLYLTGPATLNLKAKTLTMGTSSDNNGKKISYVKDASTSVFQSDAGNDNTFYFIVPAGNYANTGEGAKGLKFELESAHGTKIDNCAFEADLNAVANHLYAKTVYYDATTSGFVDDTLSGINDQLSQGGDASGDIKGASTTTGTLYVPAVAEEKNQVEQITITLKNVGTGEISIAAKGAGYTPKKVIVKVGNSYTDAEEPALNDVTLDINLPESSVEIAPIESAVTLKEVTFRTKPNVFKVKSGVTITGLKRNSSSASGDVYVEDGAKVTVDKSSSDNTNYYIFAEKDNLVTNGSANDALTKEIGNEDLYYLIYPAAGHLKTTLDKNYTLLSAININVAGVELDLNGKSLTATTNNNAIIVKGGDITISGAAGSSIDGATDAPTIDIQEGGKVTLKSGTITSVTEVYAVQVTKGTFDMEGGIIKGATTAKAITVVNGGTVTLKSQDVIGGDVEATKNVTILGAIDIAKTDAAGTVELQKGKVSGNVTVAGSTFTLTDGEVDEILVGAAGTLNVKGGTAKSIAEDTTTESNTTAGTAINISGGTIGASLTSGDAIKIVNGTPVTVNVAAGATATIGTDKATNAVDITNGSLTVKGDGTPTFKGVTVITADPAAKATVSVTLSAANAEYEATSSATSNCYVLKNSKFDDVAALIANEAKDEGDTAATAAKLSITGGYFNGDVITDAATLFINGGYFKGCTDLYKYGEERNWFVLGYGLGSVSTTTNYMPVSPVK
jgi:hypothetical protein